MRHGACARRLGAGFASGREASEGEALAAEAVVVAPGVHGLLRRGLQPQHLVNIPFDVLNVDLDASVPVI